METDTSPAIVDLDDDDEYIYNSENDDDETEEEVDDEQEDSEQDDPEEEDVPVEIVDSLNLRGKLDILLHDIFISMYRFSSFVLDIFFGHEKNPSIVL
jgi:hypothetical protein